MGPPVSTTGRSGESCWVSWRRWLPAQRVRKGLAGLQVTSRYNPAVDCEEGWAVGAADASPVPGLAASFFGFGFLGHRVRRAHAGRDCSGWQVEKASAPV